MPFQRASAFCLADLTAHWNLGYEGYFVPIQYTEVMLHHYIADEDLDLDSSPVLLDRGELVGFSYLGRRGDRGWIGGFGVAPAHRGRGIGREIFAEQMAIARRLGLARVQLEVLRQNWARRLYAHAGLRTTRDLVSLAVALPRGARAPEGIRRTTRSVYADHHARLHADFPACWPREARSQLASPGLRVLAVGPPDTPTGLLVVGRVPAALQIYDAAATDLAQAEALLAALASYRPGMSVTLTNEPEGSYLHRAMIALGAIETQRQHEMAWTSDRATSKAEGFAEGKVTGRIQALLVVLAARAIAIDGTTLRRIHEERDLDRLDRWIVRATVGMAIAEVLTDG